jgi:hypothetical protein
VTDTERAPGPVGVWAIRESFPVPDWVVALVLWALAAVERPASTREVKRRLIGSTVLEWEMVGEATSVEG